MQDMNYQLITNKNILSPCLIKTFLSTQAVAHKNDFVQLHFHESLVQSFKNSCNENIPLAQSIYSIIVAMKTQKSPTGFCYSNLMWNSPQNKGLSKRNITKDFHNQTMTAITRNKAWEQKIMYAKTEFHYHSILSINNPN